MYLTIALKHTTKKQQVFLKHLTGESESCERIILRSLNRLINHHHVFVNPSEICPHDLLQYSPLCSSILMMLYWVALIPYEEPRLPE